MSSRLSTVLPIFRPGFAIFPLLLLALTGCSREANQGPVATTTSASNSEPPSPAPPKPSPSDTLDQLDPRNPLPLLPRMANHQKENMRDHLVAVQEMVSLVATGDFKGVERAAERIGLSESMGQMCTHMGAGAPAFTEQALAFHRSADRIVAAARDHDSTRVLTALGTTLEACTACHASWKQHVVDEAAWEKATSQPAHQHQGP